MAPREGPNCPAACSYCRTKKAKCDGKQPCHNCASRREECIYSSAPRRTRKKNKTASKVLEERFAHMESLFRAAMAESRLSLENLEQQPPLTQTLRPDSDSPPLAQNALDMNNSGVSTTINEPISADESLLNNTTIANTNNNTTAVVLPLPCDDDVGSNLDPNFSWSGTPAKNGEPPYDPFIFQRPEAPSRTNLDLGNTSNDPVQLSTPRSWIEESVVSPQMSNSEHHGPTSIMSICSDPAVRWISRTAGAPDYASSAINFSVTTTRTLKMDQKVPRDRIPEPARETAEIYVTAYFQSSIEKVFAVVDQVEFRTRLAEFLKNGCSNDDAEWYALRNAIYAVGCRIYMTSIPQANAFEKSQNEAWKYFGNALSVHTELLYIKTSLVAIQALMVMSFFTESLGNPALEYMIMSNATRLALSKGLHRQPVEAWKIQKADVQKRNWLFWIIYAYDKHIAFRSGRPSAIDDDEISCVLPDIISDSHASYGDRDLKFVSHVIKHAQIASLIAKELTSIKSLRQHPDVLAERAYQLGGQLDTWWSLISKPLAFPGLTHAEYSKRHDSYHTIYLHFAYHGSVIAIHSIFAHPWCSTPNPGAQGSATDEQIESSTQRVVGAAREIIQTTKYIDLRMSWPTWLVFFYPLLGLINVFIYVIRFPSLPTTTSDLALMDIVSGHFGFLTYHSESKLSFPFVGELIYIARTAVRRARQGVWVSPMPATDLSNGGNEIPNREQTPFLASDLHSTFRDVDFSLDSWAFNIPTMSQITSAGVDWFSFDGLATTPSS